MTGQGLSTEIDSRVLAGDSDERLKKDSWKSANCRYADLPYVNPRNDCELKIYPGFIPKNDIRKFSQ
jgi:hypothetical protein